VALSYKFHDDWVKIWLKVLFFVELFFSYADIACARIYLSPASASATLIASVVLNTRHHKTKNPMSGEMPCPVSFLSALFYLSP